MTHAEWLERFKAAVRLSNEDPAGASSLLLELAEHAKVGSRDCVGEWHEQQALGTAGTFLEKSGHPDRALELYQRTLELCRSRTTYWSRAATHMLALVALLHFNQGRDDEGVRTALDALRSLGREPEADTILLDMMRELKEHQTKPSANDSAGSAEPTR
jgi:hypothetical protein